MAHVATHKQRNVGRDSTRNLCRTINIIEYIKNRKQIMKKREDFTGSRDDFTENSPEKISSSLGRLHMEQCIRNIIK